MIKVSGMQYRRNLSILPLGFVVAEHLILSVMEEHIWDIVAESRNV